MKILKKDKKEWLRFMDRSIKKAQNKLKDEGMKTKSAKAKGRKLQNKVVQDLRLAFPILEDDDIKAQIMGVSGEDVILTPAARKLIKYSFECKNQERLNLWDSLEQASTNCPEGSEPVLVFTRNRKPTYAAVSWDVFCKLIKEDR